MISLPEPLCKSNRLESTSAKVTPAALADLIARLERKAARRTRVYAGASATTPARWYRPEPRPSVQYAGHMSTEAARDRRLTPQSKALLQVLRARCGTDNETATCKTTLAHIMGVTTRSIGRYIAELARFGYITRRARHGANGLTIGIRVAITEKVLPCFRKLPWLAGWLAQNLTDAPTRPANNGGKHDRTELSYTNYSHKESYSWGGTTPDK